MINLLFVIFACLMLSVQSVEARRVVNLSAASSYTDHIDIDGKRGMMAKFIYDQGGNKISVSLITPTQHIALWEDTPYGHVMSCGKLKPSKLPFATESSSKVVYKKGHGFKSAVKHNSAKKGKVIMGKTVGVQGADSGELPLTMNNDIEQVEYTITSPGDTLLVDLGGLIIMELDKSKKSGKKIYNMVSYSNLDRAYRVNIVKDPCFGRDAQLELARSRSQAVSTALESLKVLRDDALLANTQEKQELFDKMKDIAVKSYVRCDSVDVCNQINDMNGLYNQYVDSVANIKLEVTNKSRSIDVNYLLGQTQKIDSYMATMQFSKDKAERSNAQNWCEQAIRDCNDHIAQGQVTTREGREAINVFYKAENTFYKITLR